MGWITLFTPPEWSIWKLWERLAYMAALGSFLFLIVRGALSLIRPMTPIF